MPDPVLREGREGFFYADRTTNPVQHSDRYVCPRCGATWPSPGLCRGYPSEKHPPTKVEKR